MLSAVETFEVFQGSLAAVGRPFTREDLFQNSQGLNPAEVVGMGLDRSADVSHQLDDGQMVPGVLHVRAVHAEDGVENPFFADNPSVVQKWYVRTKLEFTVPFNDQGIDAGQHGAMAYLKMSHANLVAMDDLFANGVEGHEEVALQARVLEKQFPQWGPGFTAEQLFMNDMHPRAHFLREWYAGDDGTEGMSLLSHYSIGRVEEGDLQRTISWLLNMKSILVGS